MMRRIVGLCIALFTLAPAFAQSNASEVALLQEMYGMEKRALVDQFMNVNEAEKAAFWELYDAYETERKNLAKERFNLLEEYAKVYENITDEQSDELMKKAFALNTSLDKLRKKYYGKIKKVTSAKTATKFIQFEQYLSTIMRLQLLDSIPFVGEMN